MLCSVCIVAFSVLLCIGLYSVCSGFTHRDNKHPLNDTVTSLKQKTFVRVTDRLDNKLKGYLLGKRRKQHSSQ